MTDEAAELLKQLSAPERRVLQALKDASAAVALSAAATRAGFASDDEAFSAASWLQRKGLVDVLEERTVQVRLGEDGKKFAEQKFPERRVYEHARARPDGFTLQELKAQFTDSEVQIALAWWKRKGLGTIEKRQSDTVLKAVPDAKESEDEHVLAILPRNGDAGYVSEADLKHRFPKAYEMLRQRPGVLEVKEAKARALRLTEKGRQVAAASASVEAGLGEISPEMLKSGAWRGKEFQSYDVRTTAPRTLAAKPHPLVQIIEEVRAIFVELGFQEIDEDYVQSAFWNLDALFIPQDHPAREMQDTFYLDRPATMEVPADLVERISKVHLDGGGTQSQGWGQPLDPAESQRALLRTHTTVGTIKYLSANPRPPVRVFSVGRVFRHETMDATHLPEFHQIEGICTEEGADFPMLLGILQEFYRRLGFPKLRWRPAFFPYTEPSMEVEVWTGSKWMELGGCGIFRPEVTIPFGVRTPVLAWGLGLERLAMMRLGLKDIRDLYVSDLEWLRAQPLL